MNYGPIFTPLLAAAPLNELGPGRADPAALELLAKLALDEAFAPQRIVDRTMAEACLAGLHLMYDGFEQSHAVSQEIDTPSGSYWHGILHRREGDFGNAKYWFRRVGNHPIFVPLALAARELAANEPSDSAATSLVEQEHWDPFRFVDLCEAPGGGRSSSKMLCRRIQRCECALLFDFCHRAARRGMSSGRPRASRAGSHIQVTSAR